MSGNARTGWRKQLARMKPRDRTELTLLIGGVAFLFLLVMFTKLAGEVFEGETQSFDKKILLALRDKTDLSRPIGPRWMVSAALDITALGSATVLGLTVLAVAGFLLPGPVAARASSSPRQPGGWFINSALKEWFQRPRPRHRAAPARGHDHELSKRSCASVRRRVPHPRRALHAHRAASAGEMVLHGRRDARNRAGGGLARISRRTLSYRCARRVADWVIVGVAMLDDRTDSRTTNGVTA